MKVYTMHCATNVKKAALTSFCTLDKNNKKQTAAVNKRRFMICSLPLCTKQAILQVAEILEECAAYLSNITDTYAS